MEFLRILLFPFALLYGLITAIRNLFFDLKILPSQSFDLPVISVGNLSAGGTGKTPHIEYLIRLLGSQYSVCTLSRGYGRKTKGFVAAGESENSATLGDEPMQYYRKFEYAKVFVDSNRRRGIVKILETGADPQAILLDDAFQHRYVKPGLSVLLSDYHHLYTRDYLLPAGMLRETIKGARRADIIIITKTPIILSPIVRRQLISEIKPRAHQHVYFSYIKYGEVTSLWNKNCKARQEKQYSSILLFAGIANTYPIEDHLRKKCQELVVIRYPDHHQYSAEDLNRIKRNFDDLYSRNKLLVTTEKDAMRLLQPELVSIAEKLPVHYIPIEVELHKEDKQAFDEQILNYVAKNQRER